MNTDRRLHLKREVRRYRDGRARMPSESRRRERAADADQQRRIWRGSSSSRKAYRDHGRRVRRGRLRPAQPAHSGRSLDRDGLKQAAEIFRLATPGKYEIPLQVAEDDLVVSRIVGRGVHAGELLGIPGDQHEVETDGIANHRIRDGKIVEYCRRRALAHLT